MTLETLAAVCKYGLLASTLFIFKDRACNNEKLRLRCPQGTAISVRWAQYGRPLSSESLCPPIAPVLDGPDEIQDESRRLRDRDRKTNRNETAECLASSSLDVVMNLCEGRRQCHVTASPRVFGVDPCPRIDKVLRVGYQCHPKELHTRSACRGSRLDINCSSARRIAIHSAFYGYSPGFNISECASEPSFDAGCSSACSVQIVTRLCHGRRKCRLEAGENTFGKPCQSGTREYLVVVYACVLLRTLKEIQGDIFPYSLCNEEDIPLQLTSVTDVLVRETVDHLNTTSAFTSMIVPTVVSSMEVNVHSCAAEFFRSLLWTFFFIRDNLEKFILYFIVAFCVGALIVLLLTVIRLSVSIVRYRRRVVQLQSIELRRSPILASKRTLEPDEGAEIVIERSVHPSPEPERPRRGIHRRPSSPSSPAFAHIWDSPVFVHVESPHESPVLGQQAPPSLLESPVWVRIEPTEGTPPIEPMSADSPVWRATEAPVTPVHLSPSVPSSPVPPHLVNGSRPLVETRSLSLSYTNPYRHDPYRSERRSHSVRPSRHRLPFD